MIEVEDIRWAVALVRRSVDAAVGGLEKYMANYIPFNRLCAAVIEMLTANGGWCSTRELARKFRSALRGPKDLENALTQLVREDRIEPEPHESAGRPSPGYRLLNEDGTEWKPEVLAS
jgi:hypothetical protein